MHTDLLRETEKPKNSIKWMDDRIQRSAATHLNFLKPAQSLGFRPITNTFFSFCDRQNLFLKGTSRQREHLFSDRIVIEKLTGCHAFGKTLSEFA